MLVRTGITERVQSPWLPTAAEPDHSDTAPTSSTRLSLGCATTDSVETFVQTVAAVLIHRYSSVDEVIIGSDIGQPQLRRFTFSGTASTESLMASDRFAEPDNDRHSHAVVSSVTGGEDGDGPDLRIQLARETAGTVQVTFTLRRGSCNQQVADRLAGHFATLAKAMQRHPATPVSQLDLLTDAESDTMLNDWNNTDARVTQHTNLYEAFEAQVAAHPDSTAVIHGDRTLSYRELATRVRRLARDLAQLGIGRDMTIGLCVRHSPDFLIGALGTLGAGGAYVPMDPDYPNERLLHMITGTRCEVIITNTRTIEDKPSLGNSSARLILIDEDIAVEDHSADEKLPEAPGTRARGDQLCYVMHTSGSTGAPKPIGLCHSGVLNNLADLNERFSVSTGDAVLALSSTSFDMSVFEYLGIVLAGGTVVIPDVDGGNHPATWVRLLRTHEVTVWNSAPALVDLLLDHLETVDDTGALPVRLCITGGDWVPTDMPARFRRYAPEMRFVAVGGATEASISSTFFEAGVTTATQGAYLPLGQPLANQRTYVLDESMMPVPVDVPGELYLAGRGLAREYLNMPDATAERFIEWRLGHRAAERLYRTGDVVVYRPDGILEMLGRRDFQVKIGGRRIELGEIETVLTRHSHVKQATVVARQTHTETAMLVAYVIPTREGADVADILATARESLPKFMIPSTIALVPSFPLTANGKVDRKALAGVAATRPAGSERVASAGWLEVIQAAWADILGIELSADDDFFDAGGDSIAAIKSLARIDSRLKLADIYRNPTAAELASCMESKSGRMAATPSYADAQHSQSDTRGSGS